MTFRCLTLITQGRCWLDNIKYGAWYYLYWSSCLKYDFKGCQNTPLSQGPGETFPSVGMKISIEVPMGIENLLFPAQKFQCGDGFSHSISNGDNRLIPQWVCDTRVSKYLASTTHFERISIEAWAYLSLNISPHKKLVVFPRLVDL